MPVKSRIHRVHSRTKFDFRGRVSFQIKKISDASSDSTTSSGIRLAKLHQTHARRGRRTNLNIRRYKGTTRGQKVSKMSQRKKRIHLFTISEQYKRKMSDVLDVSDEEHLKKRKISWDNEGQFVTFDKNHSIESIREAPRHKFSIDE